VSPLRGEKPISGLLSNQYRHGGFVYSVDADACNVAGVSCNVARVSFNVACVSCNITVNTCNIIRNTCNITRNTCNIKRNTCNITRVRDRIRRIRAYFSGFLLVGQVGPTLPFPLLSPSIPYPPPPPFPSLLPSLLVCTHLIRTRNCKKIAVFTYRSPHFCFPWRRPCDYHAICCIH